MSRSRPFSSATSSTSSTFAFLIVVPLDGPGPSGRWPSPVPSWSSEKHEPRRAPCELWPYWSARGRGDFFRAAPSVFGQSSPTLTINGRAANQCLERLRPFIRFDAFAKSVPFWSVGGASLLKRRFLAVVNGFCSRTPNKVSADSSELYTCTMVQSLLMSIRKFMKQSNTYSNPDQNWHWPEKTWLRERLNAIKAREQETRQKVTTVNATTEPVDSGTSAKSDPKND